MSGMTVIVPQGLSVSASSEYGSFTADRLLTQNLGQVWQGQAYRETLNITAPAGANALAIFGTNALSIEVLSIAGYVGRVWGGISSGTDWANDRAWAPGGKSNYLALTNKLHWSNDLTQSDFRQSGTLDPTIVSGLDADHGATSITDNDATSGEYIYQYISQSAPLPPCLVRFFIKKLASATYNAWLDLRFLGASTEYEGISINLETGDWLEVDDSTGTLQVSITTPPETAGWWEIIMSATPSNTSNDSVRVAVSPARYDLDTITEDAAGTGTIVVGNVELYFNNTIEDIQGTDPIYTKASAVTLDLVGTYTYLGPNINNYWLEWDGSSALSTISLKLTGPQSERVYAGVVAAGIRSNFPNPKYGLSETVREYAIHHDNPLGSSYHRKINMAREFNWSLLVGRDRQFYEMMKDIIYKYGSAPMAWRITNIAGDSTDPNRMIWGSPFMQMPQGVHAYPDNSTIKGYLREFL